jgi:signal transduction histidine kinase
LHFAQTNCAGRSRRGFSPTLCLLVGQQPEVTMSSLSNVIEFPVRRDGGEPLETQVETDRILIAERQRIARDLHDVVSHGFATIAVNAGAALEVLNEHPQQAVDALAAISAASKDAMRELRFILGTLRSVEDDGNKSRAPGLGRLDALVASTSAAGVPTEACVVGRPRPLPVAVHVAAFRIVQEALTNVLRHAGHATAAIRITYERDALIVEVEDDGRGAAGDGSSAGSGHGLVGMRERVHALGGELEAAPRSDRGFRVRARLPVLGRP